MGPQKIFKKIPYKGTIGVIIFCFLGALKQMVLRVYEFGVTVPMQSSALRVEGSAKNSRFMVSHRV